MSKDFNTWNEEKIKIDQRTNSPYFHAREIWWCALGLNIGNEQNGAGKQFFRPVIILKGMSKQTCFAVPLTSSSKKHYLRPSVGIVSGKNAYALLSQMRLIDSKRLVKKIGNVDLETFSIIRKIVKEIL